MSTIKTTSDELDTNALQPTSRSSETRSDGTSDRTNKPLRSDVPSDRVTSDRVTSDRVTSDRVTPDRDTTRRPWTSGQKILFRIAFVYFVIMALPNNGNWYKNAVSLDWLHLHYRDLYDLSRFNSGVTLFGNKLFGSTLLGYAPWIITLLVAIAAGLIWTAVARLRKAEPLHYNWDAGPLLYYWLRVIVRYRAGIGIIGFGFTKLMPTQLPYPSLGLLNTNFGDLTAQKIYWLSIGIVPWYEVFTDVVEVAAGALLFFRATTFWGAILLFGALADIVYVNFAYDGGVHGYSSYFVLLSAFLLINYIPSLYNLLIKERFTVPSHYYPTFTGWQRYVRIGLKTATIGVFLVLLFWVQYVNFRYDPYKQPAQKGVPELRGNYNVTEFRLNGKVLPYSPLDSVRWQEATFENWSTLTFKTNRAVPLDLSNGGGAPMRDLNRTFELTGVAGGQRVFYYDADPKNQVLYLQDKYRPGGPRGDGGEEPDDAKTKKPKPKAAVAQWVPKEALVNIGDEDSKIAPIARSTRRTKGIKAELRRDVARNRMILTYRTTDGSRVILSGISESKDSIYVVLDRVNRKYALSKSTLQAGTY
ncbi:hypothetical protein BN8_01861 [Fibrisoma limi BUZ 3]|uniref:DoxX family protein n=1 Tax=Fibrisoma limi BUZ 3 TaxID=1185876 RepID=I2GG03_9BACT|nr:hypothetical protein [Fibrisoma limi]CCH52828.1 hypothetical protein BN8_01861 [Fibrisoma limi BUZ 3]